MKCMYCGDTAGPFHLDHVVPRSRGGPDEPINIVNACRYCNLAKGDMLPSEWLARVPHHVVRIEQRISAIVAARARGGRRAMAQAEAPRARLECDACGRDAFPSLEGMHVAWWFRRSEVFTGERTPILDFEVLCTGEDRCLLRKDGAIRARYGLEGHLNDLPISSFFGRWSWIELQCLTASHVWPPLLLGKLVSTLRQLSKIPPANEPSTVRGERDDPMTVDD